MATPTRASRSARGTRREHRHQYEPCDLYVPGHLVHYIQAKKEYESGDPVRWGRYGGVEDGQLVVDFLDGTRRYRIHRPDEVTGVARAGDKVRVSERWRLASISRRFEPVVTVCIALPEDDWRPCSVAPAEPVSFEDLADRLAERGGFLVPGGLVTRLRGAERAEPDGDPSTAPA